MSEINTHRFSNTLFYLGIIIFIINLIYFIIVLLGYQEPRPELGISFVVSIVSIIMMGIGNKKVPYS